MNATLFCRCAQCGEEHSDGPWLLCHFCGGPAFRAWYVGGALLEGETGITVGPCYRDACAIFSALIGVNLWTPKTTT